MEGCDKYDADNEGSYYELKDPLSHLVFCQRRKVANTLTKPHRVISPSETQWMVWTMDNVFLFLGHAKLWPR